MAAWVLQIEIRKMYRPQDPRITELRGERQTYANRGNA
jgi:hypothetical protein